MVYCVIPMMSDKLKKYRTLPYVKRARAINEKRYRESTNGRLVRKRVDAKFLLKRRVILWDRKSKPCIDCGKRYHQSLMEFDHRPGEIKLFSVNLGSTKRVTEKVLDEIAKCDLVCCLCHRVRTWNRLHLDEQISIMEVK